MYWLRYKPGEANSGFIYTDGDRKDQCEKTSMTGSTVQSCVHKVPKNLTSDETYFCSVVTCGKLIIGNGTKLMVADGKAYFIAHIVCIPAKDFLNQCLVFRDLKNNETDKKLFYYFHLNVLYLDYKVKLFFSRRSPENNGLYHHTALCCISDISDSEYNHGAVMEKSYKQR